MENITALTTTKKPAMFTAQSYLRYQGDKFVSRFDANCYIHITRKLDTHDLARLRSSGEDDSESSLAHFLAQLPPTLVISIASDGLFTPSEQAFIAKHIPDSELVVIPSQDGHDGFLLEFEEIGNTIRTWLESRGAKYRTESTDVDWSVKKESLFGEAEVDITSW
jgi:homoserine O-acetyltransferase